MKDKAQKFRFSDDCLDGFDLLMFTCSLEIPLLDQLTLVIIHFSSTPCKLSCLYNAPTLIQGCVYICLNEMAIDNHNTFQNLEGFYTIAAN